MALRLDSATVCPPLLVGSVAGEQLGQRLGREALRGRCANAFCSCPDRVLRDRRPGGVAHLFRPARGAPLTVKPQRPAVCGPESHLPRVRAPSNAGSSRQPLVPVPAGSR